MTDGGEPSGARRTSSDLRSDGGKPLTAWPHDDIDWQTGRLPDNEPVHLVDFDTDSNLAKIRGAPDRSLCGKTRRFEPAAADADRFCVSCARSAEKEGIELPAEAVIEVPELAPDGGQATVDAVYGDKEIIMYGQPGDHALFARPTGDPDIETPTWSFDGPDEIQWAIESLEKLLPEDDPELRADGGLSIDAAELEARKQAWSSTPRDQRKRCPECGSTNVTRKTGKHGTAERGEWCCKEQDCLTHFDEPVTGGVE